MNSLKYSWIWFLSSMCTLTHLKKILWILQTAENYFTTEQSYLFFAEKHTNKQQSTIFCEVKLLSSSIGNLIYLLNNVLYTSCKFIYVKHEYR